MCLIILYALTISIDGLTKRLRRVSSPDALKTLTPVKCSSPRVALRCVDVLTLVDGQLMFYLWYLIQKTTAMLIRFCAIMIFSPLFAIPGSIMTVWGGWCGQLYIKAQLPIKRERSSAKAPVLGKFGAAIAGLSKSYIRMYPTCAKYNQLPSVHMVHRTSSDMRSTAVSIVIPARLSHTTILLGQSCMSYQPVTAKGK